MPAKHFFDYCVEHMEDCPGLLYLEAVNTQRPYQFSPRLCAENEDIVPWQ
jgi:hypothetical protein